MDKLKTAFRRANQTVKQRLGMSEETRDAEFEELKQNYEMLKKASFGFTKHLRGMVENYHAVSTTIMLIGEDVALANRDGTSSGLQTAAEKLKEISQSYDDGCIMTFQQSMNELVVDPMALYCDEFDQNKSLFDEYKKCKLDYDYHRNELKKIAEKSGSGDPLKLPRAKERVAAAKERYDEIVSATRSKMVELMIKRDSIFETALKEFANLTKGLADDIARSSSTFSEFAKISFAGESPYTSYLINVSESSDAPAASPAPISRPPPSIPKPAAAAKSVAFSPEYDVEWFYLDADNSQLGPVDIRKLHELYKSMQISDETYVFGGEMASWEQVATMPKLVRELAQ